jgi:hypothetical protein
MFDGGQQQAAPAVTASAFAAGSQHAPASVAARAVPQHGPTGAAAPSPAGAGAAAVAVAAVSVVIVFSRDPLTR